MVTDRSENTNFQSLNRYAYALNNPASNNDPSGLKTCADDTMTADTDPLHPYTCVDVVAQYEPPDPSTNVGVLTPQASGPGMPASGSSATIGSAAAQTHTSQQPQKKPCTPLPHDPPLKGVDTTIAAFFRFTHPLETLRLNTIMFVTGGATAATAAGAIALACFVPEPAEPLACAAGVIGGVPTYAGGVFLLKQSASFFKNYTLPAIKDWGCHE